MKIKPILIFLLFSLPAIAQNMRDPEINNFYLSQFKMLAGQSLIDKKPAEKNLPSFSEMMETDGSSTSGPEDFTSFTLMQHLEELDRTTPFNLVHTPTLERYIRVFLQNRRESLADLMDRAAYYFPLFEKTLDKYDLPLEIKYLAVIESALKPMAKSRTGARGLWQFTYATGKQYGLEINSLVDERYDPVKATDAACRFLDNLYKMFNDWDLALAAYNSGPGNVRKALLRSGGKTSYWEIRKYLPSETRGYIPAFYATFYLFEYRNYHHLSPSRSSVYFYETDTLKIGRELSLRSISRTLKTDYEFLTALNPQYKTGIIPGSRSKQYTLTLPVQLIDEFIRNEKNISGSDRKKQIPGIIKVTPENSYKVQKGDNLLRIAERFHISVEQLKEWNGLETNYLIKDQRLVVTNKK